MFEISTKDLTINELQEIDFHTQIRLSPDAEEKIQNCRSYLDKVLNDSDETYYGINTGFGALHDVKIDKSQIQELQENLVKSHACGTGNLISTEIVKWMLFLKVKNISLGHSAVSMEVVNRLILMYNENLLPVIYEQGSLGASGDLAPLAHMSLPLIGLGEIQTEGQIHNSLMFKDRLGDPIKLQAKEGLALLNGTQFMSAHGLWAALESRQLCEASYYVAALSYDAFYCKTEPLDAKIQKVRRQKGQEEVARKMRELLKSSPIAESKKEQTQDPYSFRCIPQVQGACLDVMKRVEEILENEINAVTDNPIIFPEEDEILSGGNFHGEILALHLDHLTMAVAEIASISERRCYKLVSGERGLPPFLVAKPGLNSGLMIAQYTAASIVSQNKQLSTPASVDTIDSSNGQEDHVSMGANAATKMAKVIDNAFTVIAIELLCASQAMSFRDEKSSPVLMDFMNEFRKVVPVISHDRVLHYDIQKAKTFVRNYKFPQK